MSYYGLFFIPKPELLTNLHKSFIPFFGGKAQALTPSLDHLRNSYDATEATTELAMDVNHCAVCATCPPK